jgi:DNA-directed RNA polymerase subunit RPC12/RpoP
MFRWVRSLLRPRKQVLIVMRTADMVVVHPLTDFSRKCARCGEEVGIYPSGQAVIGRFGKKTEIVCNYCIGAEQVSGAQPAPGALSEAGQSIRNPFRQEHSHD